MRCLTCNNNLNDEVLKLHYQYYHSINENNYFFKELFLPDNACKDVMSVRLNLKIAGQKGIIIFCSTIIRQEATETSSYD